MPSLSEILKSKTESNQQRIESRRAERQEISTLRDESLMSLTTTPELYDQFLVLQADNISLSAGNVALAMAQLVDPTRIGTTDFWHEQGRFVMDAEMQNGAKVFVRPRNKEIRGYFMGNYYDISQTGGKPMKEPEPLTEGPRLDKALSALLDTSPVAFVENTKLETAVRYNEKTCTLEINTERSTGEVFAALATEISYARVHNRGQNRDFDREGFKLTAESIGFMVCRRFGVDCPLPKSENVAQYFSYYETEDRRQSLDLMRQTAKSMGDTVERGIQPRRQEQTNNRNNTRRQYGAR